MATPGEVHQLIGQAYQLVFVGALEANIRYFENVFNVHTEPEKTLFAGRNGSQFSFDFSGVYNHPWQKREVFGECKGYTKGSNLLQEYRSFIAKSYVTTIDYPRHRKDFFWFITNVPFACTEGAGVRSFNFVRTTLREVNIAGLRDITGSGHIDDEIVHDLLPRIGVFILTDSYLMNTEVSYKVAPGDTLWSILKRFHAGRAPSDFRFFAEQIAKRNQLASADQIRSGERIRFSWLGLD